MIHVLNNTKAIIQRLLKMLMAQQKATPNYRDGSFLSPVYLMTYS